VNNIFSESKIVTGNHKFDILKNTSGENALPMRGINHSL
jgi:hypothetical protein